MFKTITKIISNDRIGSWTGVVFFTFWIGQRFYFSHTRPFVWWLITIQFSVFVIAYLTRAPAKDHARGFKEIVFPFICAGLPFALEGLPFKPSGSPVANIAPVYIGLMITGTLIIILSLLTLRSSFSIMAEVREMKTGGLYRWSRHPMYLGSIVATLGTMLARFSILNLFIFLVFCGLQVYRSILEERKIIAVFPNYLDYARKVGWVWKLGRR